LCLNLGRLIRHRACELRDVCQFHINAELDMEFELLCQQVTEARKQRGKRKYFVCFYFLFSVV
jgi:hypothetical protein